MIGATSARRAPAIDLVFAVTSGSLVALAEAFLLPIIVLAFFVSRLTDSLLPVAFVATVHTAGWLVPQLLAPWMSRLGERRMPWALAAGIVRAAAIVLLAYVAYRDGLSDPARLRSTFVCYAAYCLAAGFAQLPSLDAVSWSTAPEQRGQLVAMHNLFGGVLALVAGLCARQALGTDGPDFSRNVALLFIGAATALATAALFLARLRDSISPSAAPELAVRGSDFRAVMGDTAFRRYTGFGLLAATATIADPFIVVFATRELGASSAMVGTYLTLFALGALASGPVWSWVARQGGARTCLQTAVAFRVMVPVVALLLPPIVASSTFSDRFTDPELPSLILGLAFAILGAAIRAQLAGNFAYVSAIAVPERRRAYHALSRVNLLAAAVAPLIGAAIASRYSFERLFLVAALAGLVAVLGGGLLTQTSTRIRAPGNAWRIRNARI